MICDRSLEPFDYPMQARNKIVFKYGDTDEEITDEIMIIHRDTATLELGQYIYEFIALAIPLKKLHPKFQDEERRRRNQKERLFIPPKTSDGRQQKTRKLIRVGTF